jgi:hypothetical protein
MPFLPLTICHHLSAAARYAAGYPQRLSRTRAAVPARKAGQFVKILKGKSACIIVTMRMPGFIYPMVVWGACGKNA